MATFGERLKELRTNQNMTQTELGEILGLKRRMIQYLESNEREPNLETINKLCEIFNCTSDYLMGRSDDHNPSVVWEDMRRLLNKLVPFNTEKYYKVRKLIDDLPNNKEVVTHGDMIKIEEIYQLYLEAAQDAILKGKHISDTNAKESTIQDS